MKTEEQETNWKELTYMLVRELDFCMQKLKPNGWEGMILTENEETGKFEQRHWREDIADAIDSVPGCKTDREMMYAFDLPKAQREKEIRRIMKSKEKGNQA